MYIHSYMSPTVWAFICAALCTTIDTNPRMGWSHWAQIASHLQDSAPCDSTHVWVVLPWQFTPRNSQVTFDFKFKSFEFKSFVKQAALQIRVGAGGGVLWVVILHSPRVPNSICSTWCAEVLHFLQLPFHLCKQKQCCCYSSKCNCRKSIHMSSSNELPPSHHASLDSTFRGYTRYTTGTNSIWAWQGGREQDVQYEGTGKASRRVMCSSQKPYHFGPIAALLRSNLIVASHSH